VILVMLVDPWDFPFLAGLRIVVLGQRLWIFSAGRSEAGVALILRHVGRWFLVATHLSCVDLKGVLDYALLA
jgi:hypothetical protein